MSKAPTKTIIIGTLLGASSLAAAHGSEQAAVTVLHFLTSPDHLAVIALVAAGAVAILTQRVLGHLRKAPSRKQ